MGAWYLYAMSYEGMSRFVHGADAMDALLGDLTQTAKPRREAPAAAPPANLSERTARARAVVESKPQGTTAFERLALAESKSDWPKSFDELLKLGDTVFAEFKTAATTLKAAVVEGDSTATDTAVREVGKAQQRLQQWSYMVQSSAGSLHSRANGSYGYGY